MEGLRTENVVEIRQFSWLCIVVEVERKHLGEGKPLKSLVEFGSC